MFDIAHYICLSTGATGVNALNSCCKPLKEADIQADRSMG